VTAVSHSEIAV